ncbi:hypothetical protein Ciccas_011916 [Cichlidogyrus casuarinus]|uniref:Phospholipase A2-like central domain-containing protein n=1 Tax=Cichlidogyrus casuarinus TaxID=1844966 RepID=A0ABD2PR54_9PLAT
MAKYGCLIALVLLVLGQALDMPENHVQLNTGSWKTVLPGTLWCGKGNRATNYEQLGYYSNLDKCCRAHDNCPHVIRSGASLDSFTNKSPYTISYCDCDLDFAQCLQDIQTGYVESALKETVKLLYWSYSDMKCFQVNSHDHVYLSSSRDL